MVSASNFIDDLTLDQMLASFIAPSSCREYLLASIHFIVLVPRNTESLMSKYYISPLQSVMLFLGCAVTGSGILQNREGDLPAEN